MSRFLFFLSMILAFLPMYAESGNYDELIQKSSSWTSERILEVAETFMSDKSEEEAMVLYMVVISRQHVGLDEAESKIHVKAHLRAGDIHYARGNYSNALRYYVSGLKLSEASESHPYLAVLYKNMGNVYNMFQDYEKGQSLYLSGLEEARRVKESDTEYKLLQNLVGVSINLQDVRSARRYYEQSCQVRHKHSDESDYMEHYTHALILKHEGKDREAVEKFKSLAREASHKGLDARYQCSAYGEIGRIYVAAARQDSAIYYLSRCKDVAQANGILYQYTESLKMLYSLYDNLGDRVRSAEIKDRYLELKDSIYNQRQFDMARNQQFLYEMEKSEREIADLNDRQARSAMLISRQRIILWSALGAVVLALLFLYYFYRQKTRLGESYRKLYDIHQRMTAEHKEHRERYAALSKENKKLQEMMARLLGKPSKPERSDREERPENIPESKYESSALSHVQRDRLADEITEAMEVKQPFCSPDFSLNALAALVGSNSKYVSQVINDVFGKNFSTYVNEYRVNLACERLADDEDYGRYSMNGIGESVGFKSGGTFTAVFKKMTGITPSLYQKLTREKKNKGLKTGKGVVKNL